MIILGDQEYAPSSGASSYFPCIREPDAKLGNVFGLVLGNMRTAICAPCAPEKREFLVERGLLRRQCPCEVSDEVLEFGQRNLRYTRGEALATVRGKRQKNSFHVRLVRGGRRPRARAGRAVRGSRLGRRVGIEGHRGSGRTAARSPREVRLHFVVKPLGGEIGRDSHRDVEGAPNRCTGCGPR